MGEKKLAVIFPGMGYHNDKPLLYHGKKLAKERGYEVVEVNYVLDKNAGAVKDDETQKKEVFRQAYSQTEEQLAKVKFASYQEVVFIGKSIGTVVASKYALDHRIPARQVVFTPVPQTFSYLTEGPNVVFHGTKDPWCSDEEVFKAKEKFGFTLEQVKDANHSLETDNTVHNIHLLADIINQVGMFLLEGNKDAFSSKHLETFPGHKLAGKKVLFLGSSVTYGYASMQDGLPEYFHERFGCTSVKEAISGTTLVDREEISYVNRLKKYDVSEKFDLMICQLSTNDANLRLSLGDLTDRVAAECDGAAGWDALDLEAYDTMTITGAMEYIIAYAKKNWNCPVYFYTNARYDNAHYETMVDRLFQIQKKWGIGVFDLWTSDSFNAISEADRNLYMADAIHPTKAGYMKWWGPEIERQLTV